MPLFRLSLFRRRGRQALVPVLAFLALLCLGLWRVHHGFDFTDEGFYLAAPLRFVLGDRPFADEWDMSMYTVILPWTLVLKLHPDLTLVQARMLGVATQLLGLGVLLAVLRPYASATVLALALASVAYMGNGLFTPAYNWLGQTGCILFAGLWCLGSRQRRKRDAVALGLASLLAWLFGVVCYPPLAMLGILPPLWWLGRRCFLSRSTRATAPGMDWTCGAFSLVVAIMGGAALLAALWRGGEILQQARVNLILAANLFLTPKKYQDIGKFLVLDGLAPALAATGTFLCCWLPLPRRDWGVRGAVWVAVMAGSVGVAWAWISGRAPFYHWVWEPTPWAFFVGPVALGLALSGWLARWLEGARWPEGARQRQGWRCVQVLTAAGLMHYLLLPYMSSVGPRNSRYAAAMLLAAATASCLLSLSRAGLDAPRRLARLAALLAALALYQGWSVATLYFNDAPLDQQTATFSHPLLRGVRTTPDKVADLEGLMAWLSPRLERGETLLVLDDAAVVYYLARARPALPKTWEPTAWNPPPERRQAYLDWMHRQGRAPRFAVLADISNPDDPVARYVHAEHVPVSRHGRFTVWERRPGLP